MADRRIIAIAVTPRAYDEILKLKGNTTWTDFVLRAVDALVGGNIILTDELDNLPKKAEKKVKEPKPKPVKKLTKAEKKAKKGKKEKKADEVTGEQESAEAAIEAEVPSAEEAERVDVEGEGTLIMPHTHKDKKVKTEKSEEVR